MEIIIIEPETLRKMEALMEQLRIKINSIAGHAKPKCLEQWVDNQHVCMTLNISKRTLQAHRKRGLAYSKVEHKIFYRPQDIERFILKTGQFINRKNYYYEQI